VTQLTVPDAWRLIHAGPGLQADDSLTFIFEFNPSPEDIDELKACSMKVRLARELLALSRSDYERVDSALRCHPYSEVSVLIEGP